VGEKGNGVRVSESIEVDEFDRVEISGAFTVILAEEESNTIKIETDENLLEFIEVAVRGNSLEVGTDRRLDSEDGIIIYIPVTNLEGLDCSGASDISTRNFLNTEDIKITISGAGKLELMLKAGNVSLDVSGATLVYLEGMAERLEVDMSGAGSLEASEFEVEDCSAQISGVGNIVVNVTGELDAEVSGLGKVEYVGDPASVKGDVSGVGNVSKK